jgi:Arylsulfotransferase (ASST)
MIFLSGFVAGKAGMFPSSALSASWEAVSDWSENWRHYLGLRSRFILPSTRTEGGVIKHDASLAFDGYTLVVAYRPTRHGGFNAYLIDMDGRTVNEWDADVTRIWPDLAETALVGLESSMDIHGAYLYDNGDVVLDIGAVGTAKLDRCSNVRWAVRAPTHHAVEPLPDGSILTPSTINRTERAPGQLFAAVGPAGSYMDDTILRIGPDGSRLEEKSVIDILLQGGWASALISGPGGGKVFAEDDPLHVNDVEVLTPELAPAFPMFAAGDVMISVRHLNTVFVADPVDWTVKWLMTGPFVGQHDPDFLPNGHIMLFDNRLTGTTPRLGNTRLLEIDPLTRAIVWSFEGTGDQVFYAHSRGEQQLLPNGDILLVDPHGGRLLEIAPAAGNRTVWEWVNLVGPGEVGLVTGVQRVAGDALTWVGKPCGAPADDTPVAQVDLRGAAKP